MKQAILNVTFSRDIHDGANSKIGIFTYLQMERQLFNGRKRTYRTFCSYETKSREKLPNELRKLRYLKWLFSKFFAKRRAA